MPFLCGWREATSLRPDFKDFFPYEPHDDAVVSVGSLFVEGQSRGPQRGSRQAIQLTHTQGMATFQAFLDESRNIPAGGDATADRGSSLRVLTAVVLSSTARIGIEDALAALCLGSEPAGTTNDALRPATDASAAQLARLKALEPLGLTICAAVFDAEAVSQDGGPADPASLDSFLHGLVHRAMVNRHPDVDICMAQATQDNRAAGFAAWLETNHPVRDLFTEARIVVAQTADEPLLALAGFISSVLAAAFGTPACEDLRATLLQWMQEGRVSIDQWPTRLHSDDRSATGLAESSDSAVRELSLAMAERFIDTHRSLSSDELLRQQSLTVGYLLFQAKFGSGRHASAAELIAYLGSRGHTVSDHQLKSTVIAQLRDQDVLISSSSRGYKIPQNRHDFLNFMRLVDGQTLPLLDRLQRARRSLERAGANLSELVDQPRFARLKRVLDVLDESETPPSLGVFAKSA